MTNPSWFEHVDLMQVVIVALLGTLIYFVTRTLSKIDQNQQTLFEKLENLSNDFHELKGEHKAMKERCMEAIK